MSVDYAARDARIAQAAHVHTQAALDLADAERALEGDYSPARLDEWAAARRRHAETGEALVLAHTDPTRPVQACSWCRRPETDEDPVRRLPLRPATALCPSCTRVYYQENE